MHLRAHYRRLGRRSLRLRFLGEPSDAVLDRLADRAEPELLLEAVADGGVRGLFEAYPTEPGRAEIALSVEDEYQSRGIGRYLFDEGLKALASRGFATAELLCLRENGAVLHLVRTAGGRIRFEGGEAAMEIELDQALGPRASPLQ